MLRTNNKQRNDTTVCKPQLTSLIDVMTILLVFLMVHFSVDGNLITPSADLELPASSAEATPETVTTLEITSTAVLSNGEPIVAISSFINGDSLTIPQITDWLERHTSIRSGEIMLQADRRTPFSIMKRVMYTCSRAGYDDFTILVRQEG